MAYVEKRLAEMKAPVAPTPVANIEPALPEPVAPVAPVVPQAPAFDRMAILREIAAQQEAPMEEPAPDRMGMLREVAQQPEPEPQERSTATIDSMIQAKGGAMAEMPEERGMFDKIKAWADPSEEDIERMLAEKKELDIKYGGEQAPEEGIDRAMQIRESIRGGIGKSPEEQAGMARESMIEGRMPEDKLQEAIQPFTDVAESTASEIGGAVGRYKEGKQGLAETAWQAGSSAIGGLAETMGVAGIEAAKAVLPKDVENYIAEKGQAGIKALWEAGNEDAKQTVIDMAEKWDNMSDRQKENIGGIGEVLDLASIFVGGKAGKQAITDSAKVTAKIKKTAKPLAKAGLRKGKGFLDDTAQKLTKYASGIGDARQASKAQKAIAKSTKLKDKATKLATEIIDPPKKELTEALKRGELPESVKEFVKIVEEAPDFKTLKNTVRSKTDDLFKQRNKIIEADNFKLKKAPTDKLDEYIKKVKKGGVATDSQIKKMEDVIGREKDWFAKNNPTRLQAQKRKEFLQEQTQTLLKQRKMGTLNEDGAKELMAWDKIRAGYMEAVEGGDDAIREINSRYSGLNRAIELLSGKEASALKASSQTRLQKIAAPAVDLLSASTGAGSAAFVARRAAKQQKSLKGLTKELIKFRDEASSLMKNYAPRKTTATKISAKSVGTGAIKSPVKITASKTIRPKKTTITPTLANKPKKVKVKVKPKVTV